MALALFVAALASANNGSWVFKEREVNSPSELWIKRGQNIHFDQQDHGLSSRCSYVDVNKKTVVDAGHLSWSLDFSQQYLVPGQQIKARLSLDRSAGDGRGWSGTIKVGYATLAYVSISDPKTPPTTDSVGKVPDKLQNPRTGVINPLVISFELSSGNEVCSPTLKWIYEWKEGIPPVASSPSPAPLPISIPVPPAPSTGSDASRQQPASPVASETGGRYLGCFADKEQRDLNDIPGFWVGKAQTCIDRCGKQGFSYAAVQAGSTCFCDNKYGRYGPSNACVPCRNAPSENCGGTWANSVYATGAIATQGTSAVPVAAAGSTTVTAPSSPMGTTGAGDNMMPNPHPKNMRRSLTGAWVHSSNGTTETPDSKVIIIQDDEQVTMLQSYKSEVNRNQWQTLRCIGPLVANQVRFQCNWAPGGNPMGFGGPWQPTFELSGDGNHLDGIGKDAHHYSRVP